MIADSRVRFRVALALGEAHEPRAVAALARIARRDSVEPMDPDRGAQLVRRDRRPALFAELELKADRNPRSPTMNPADIRELLKQLVEIVGARNRPDEVGRVLDVLAADDGGAIDATWLDARDRMVLALARGVRRSGGRLPIDPDSARPGAALVVRLVQRARTWAQDELVRPSRHS